MSRWVHEWCRDVSRDEAIRAAEDAAAAERTPLPDHRDLPQAVAELRERVARLTTKHNALVDLARLDAGWVKTQEDCLAAERDAAIRERDEAQSEAAGLRNRLEAEYAPGLRSLANNLRDKLRDCESALKRVEGERDAAKEECERLRARVAELERERAELRAHVQILAEGQPTYPSDLGVWCTAKELSVRCKELAARLVRTAVRASTAEARVAELEAGEGRGGCEHK